MNYTKLTIAEACGFIFTGGTITVSRYQNLKRPVITVFTHGAVEVGKLTEKQLDEILSSGVVDLKRTSENKYVKCKYFELYDFIKTEMNHFCITELLNTLDYLYRKEKRKNDTNI